MRSPLMSSANSKRPLPEIFGGQGPGLVDDVDEHRGAEGRQGLAAHRVLHEVLGPLPGRGLEFVRIGQGHAGSRCP